MKKLLMLILLFSAFLYSGVSAQVIQTIAGGIGDGGLATNAVVQPVGVAADRHGNLYVVDNAANMVRKISSTGVISTFAGTGNSGYNSLEDHHLAINAQLNQPNYIVCDTFGNVFVSDYGNGRIRKIDTMGVITTVVVVGANGLARDNAGNLYFSPNGSNAIRKMDIAGSFSTYAGTTGAGFGGDGGAASAATLNSPGCLVVDAIGNLYIADRQNFRVRKVDTNHVITTVAGNGTAGYAGDGGYATAAVFNTINGLAVDAGGNLFIADYLNNVVRKVSTSGIVSKVAGSPTSAGFSGDGGMDTASKLYRPAGMAFDNSGNLYISDNANARIRKITTGHIISTVGGSGRTSAVGSYGDGGLGINALLNNPMAVCIDAAQNFYVADAGNHIVRKLSPDGIITTLAGNGTTGNTGNGGPATNARLAKPSSVAIDRNGNVFICDEANHCIRKVDTSGIIVRFAGNSTAGFSGDGGAATAAQFNHPIHIIFDKWGNLLVADNTNNRVRKVDTTGLITTVAGTGSTGFYGDGGQATDALIGAPSGMAVDDSGNLYLAGSSRVRKVDLTGIISTIAGTGAYSATGDGGPASAATFYNPNGLAFDKAGNLFVLDGGYYIRRIDTSGIVSLYGGRYGYTGASGDGESALLANVSSSFGIAADSTGNLIFPDANNSRIRKIFAARLHISTASDTLCAGLGALFTAAVTNASGSIPVYHWYRNGVSAGTDSFAWVSGALGNGDVVTCTLTDSITGRVVAISDTIRMSVLPIVSPSIVIAYSTADTICAGTLVTCTVHIVGGGNAPAYTWFENGFATGTTDTTFSFIPNNGDVIRCRLLSNQTCRLYDTISSAPKTFVVIDTLMPAVAIHANCSDTICNGTSVVYTAMPSNADPSAKFTWYIHGFPYVTSASFAYGPLPHDSTYCRMTNPGRCKLKDTVFSAPKIFTFRDTIFPSVTITSDLGDTVCSNLTVNLTATAVNAGTHYSFNWFTAVDSIIPGANMANHTYWPKNGSEIFCRVDCVYDVCVSRVPAFSNIIKFTVLDTLQSSVSIVTTPGDNICPNQLLTCKALVVNGGPDSIYYWYVNGKASMAFRDSFAVYPAAGDQINCIMVSTKPCANIGNDTSETHTINILGTVTPTVDVSVSPGTIRIGKEVTLTATGTNLGTNPKFDWLRNGGWVATGNPFKYTPAYGDVIYCQLTSSEPCAAPTVVNSLPITISVDTTVSDYAGIYPNPNAGTFKIHQSIDGPDGMNVYVTICGIDGKVIHQQTLVVKNNLVTADISLGRNLPEGVYLASLIYFTGKVPLYFVVRY